MTLVPGNFSSTLVQEFCTVYKGELEREYPQGKLWKGGDPITSLTIYGVRMNISPRTILRILHGPNFQPPGNTVEIEYYMDVIWKVIKKKMISTDIIMYFICIANLIAINGEESR